MANYTGLSFDSNNVLTNYSNKLANIGVPALFKRPSVPITITSNKNKQKKPIKKVENTSTIITPSININSISPSNTQSIPLAFTANKSLLETNTWMPEALQNSQEKVNKLINLDINGKDSPLYALDNWNKGLKGMSESERKAWEYANASKIEGKSEENKEQIWKNQQYYKLFGDKVFYSTPAEELNKRYYNYLASKAIIEKYGSNANIEQLLSLSPEAKDKLLHSDYKSDAYYKDEAEDRIFDKKYSWKDRLYSGLNTSLSRMGFGTVAGATAGSVLPGFGTVAGAAAGTIVGGVEGLLEGIAHPEEGASYLSYEKKENDEIFDKILVEDNKKLKQEKEKEINEANNQLYIAFKNGQVSENDINKMFDDVALNNDKKDYVDELGNKRTEKYTGSNYYTAFKNTDEFSHFDVYDKMRYIAQTQVLNKEYGQFRALSVLDNDMQNYANTHQSKLTWGYNTLHGITFGGVANIVSKAAGIEAINAYIQGGTEGLAAYLEGKDTSSFIDPQFWNKVDQYNINPFSFTAKQQIANIDKAGGVSPYNNVAEAGTEEDFWTWYNALNGVSMSKYAWSDALTNWLLARFLGLAVKGAGGIKLPSGALASESTKLSKFLNVGGSAGIVGVSTAGIAEAYGLQTYNETLEENNKRLDAKIDTDVERELQRIAESPEEQAKAKAAIAKENARRKAQAGERGNYIPVDADKAWQAHLDYTREHLRKKLEQEHAKDRLQARKDAANAYITDASIEALRMSGINTMLKGYLFDKGTLQALKLNNPYVNVTTKDGLYAVGKKAVRNKILSTAAKNVWGGFYSNYMDDVTVGFAKGFGMQSYNNYLYNKYNPEAYGDVLDSYVSPFIAALNGAKHAALSKRAFVDGGIGALGTAFTVVPHPISGTYRHKQLHKEIAEQNAVYEQMAKVAKEKGKTFTKPNNAPHWSEIASLYITHPFLSAVADAKSSLRTTEGEISRVNGVMKDNEYAMNNMVETLSAQNAKEITRQGTSILEAEDAKDKAAFTLASSLNTLKNSGVVANAQEDSGKGIWNKKQSIASKIAQSFNMLLGNKVFIEDPSTPYLKAMQDLNDAATLGEKVDSEKAERQKKLINTFLTLDDNKNVLDTMSDTEKQDFAISRLKKNATDILDVMQKMNKIQKKFESSIGAQQHPDLANQLMYQYILDDRYKKRFGEMEGAIRGEEITEDNVNDILKASIKNTSPQRMIAQYGSLEGYNRVLASQEAAVEKAEEEYKKAEEESKKGYNPTKSVQENVRIKAQRQFITKELKEEVKKRKRELKRIKKDKNSFTSLIENNSSIIEAENILRLDAEDRAKMLDDFYKKDYTEEQQEEIDKAKEILIRRDGDILSSLQKVKDSAILKRRISDNMTVANKIMKNPMIAIEMINALKDNRKAKIIDYFDDKVVGEAFDALIDNIDNVKNIDSMYDAIKDKSIALLKGLQAKVKSEIKKSSGLYDQKDLDIFNDAIAKVVKERKDRLKEISDVISYADKAKSIKHKEIVSTPSGEISLTVDGTVSQEYSQKQLTKEIELSNNDKELLSIAFNYAVDKNIPLENLSQEVGTKAFNDYFQEFNHRAEYDLNPNTGDAKAYNGITLEESTNQVSSGYMQNLIRDVVDNYTEHNKKIEKETKPKETSSTPESIVNTATDPQIKTKEQMKEKKESEKDKTKTKSNVKEEDRRPDDKPATNDPFGLKVKKDNLLKEEKEAREGTFQKNTPSLKEALADKVKESCPNIVSEVNVLLDTIESIISDLKISSKNKKVVHDEIENIINGLLDTNTYTDLSKLKNDIIEEAAINLNPAVNSFASMLANKDDTLTETEKEKGKKEKQVDKADNTLVHSLFHSMPVNTLETIDLSFILNKGKDPSSPYHVLYKYVMKYNVSQVLDKLGAGWQEGKYRQAQVVFLYDKELAKEVQDSMGNRYNPEINSPVVLAIEINTKKGTTEIVDNDSALITIDNKQYQPLGFMPSNDNQNTNSALWMQNIRNLINFNSKNSISIIRKYGSKGAHNGSAIMTNISTIEVNTNENQYPEGNAETPKKSVISLMDENYSSPSESLIGSVSEEDANAYEKAKQSGNIKDLRKTSVYKKLRKAFLQRLAKVHYSGERDRGALVYTFVKGSRDSYVKEVIPIAEFFKLNSRVDGRPIISILREYKDTSEEDKAKVAKELIDSNSRFSRFAYMINNIASEISEKESEEIKNKLKKAFSNNFNLSEGSIQVYFDDQNSDNPSYRLEISDITGSTIASLTINKPQKSLFNIALNNQEVNIATFITDALLNDKGEARKNERGFGLVKAEIKYNDAEVLNGRFLDTQKEYSEEKKKELMKHAEDNFNALYDDGVFSMQVSKMGYSKTVVTVLINNKMRELSDTPTPSKEDTPTGKTPSSDIKGKNGEIIDSNTGALLEKGKGKEGKEGSAVLTGKDIPLSEETQEVINRIKEDSKKVSLNPDEKNYTIKGQLYARVTSIKNAIANKLGLFGTRFNPNNAWKAPSTCLGNTFDKFARDVFNRIFIEKSKDEIQNRLSIYGNSTVSNYFDCLLSLNKLSVKALKDGKMFLPIGDAENPGSITVAGQLKIKVKDTEENTSEKYVRVAGTVDALAVDSEGNFYIYDFKTHHGNTFTAKEATEKGYNKQLSMYANFLEQKYNIKVKGLYIIPVKVEYPKPKGQDNEGNEIGGTTEYQKGDGINNDQLMIKNRDGSTSLFTKANYKVEEVFQLERLSSEELMPSYGKLNDEDKKAIIEALNDQEGNNQERNKSIFNEKTEVTIAEIEEEIKEELEKSNVVDELLEDRTSGLLKILKERRKRKLAKLAQATSTEDILGEIDKSKTVQEDIDRKNKECANPKP